MDLNVLSPAELSALRLDGEITLTHALIDDADDWRQRSHRIIGKALHKAVLTGYSAAWALHCGPEPYEHSVSYVSLQERSFGVHPFFRVEERLLSESDVLLNGFTGVTTPLRTCLDLLRITSESTEKTLEIVSNLQSSFGVTKESLIAIFASKKKIPYKTIALERINLL